MAEGIATAPALGACPPANYLFFQQLPHALLALALFVADFALFLLPGLAAATLLSRRRRFSPLLLVIFVVTVSATCGYAAFWAFFFSRTAGRFFCYSLYLASVLFLFRSRTTLRSVTRLVRVPFLYSFLAGLLYTSLLFGFSDPVESRDLLAGQRFFHESRPGDNLIPLFLADRIYDRAPLRPFCCGGWLTSDRPPLQTGIFLLERPFRLVGGTGLHYQLFSTALQCLWVCGGWCLLVALGTPETRIRQVLVFLILSGFLFYNSVYTWPKLLASGCVLFALSILFDLIRQHRNASTFEILLLAGSLGLTLMSHPGSVFSLPAFAFLALRHRRIFRLHQIATLAAVLAVFALPWTAYQKLVDPPGDRLLKMHLAGEIDIQPESTWQVVRNAYTRHPLPEIISFKLSNLRLLLGRNLFDTYGLNAISTSGGLHIDTERAERSRIAQREWIWNAIGLLNFGWLAGVVLLWSKKMTAPAVPLSGTLIAAALVNLAVWSVVLFGPDATSTTHSSYADILLLSIGLLGWLLTMPLWAVTILLALQIFNLLFVWTWPSPLTWQLDRHTTTVPVTQLPFLVFGGLAIAALLWILRSSEAPKSAEQPPAMQEREEPLLHG